MLAGNITGNQRWLRIGLEAFKRGQNMFTILLISTQHLGVNIGMVLYGMPLTILQQSRALVL